MKLINVEMLNDQISAEYNQNKRLYEENGYNERFGVVRGLGKASEMICKQPIVDAAPVIHAKWVSSVLDKDFRVCSRPCLKNKSCTKNSCMVS